MATRQYRKKVKPGAIELDPVESAIVVHVETFLLDTTQQDGNGQPLVVQQKSSQKRINLRTFNENSTVSRFAEEIVARCKYIHPSRVPVVEGLLVQLQQRLRLAKQPAPTESAMTPKEPAPLRGEPAREQIQQIQAMKQSQRIQPAQTRQTEQMPATAQPEAVVSQAAARGVLDSPSHQPAQQPVDPEPMRAEPEPTEGTQPAQAVSPVDAASPERKEKERVTRPRDKPRRKKRKGLVSKPPKRKKASMKKVETYLGKLYEESIAEKIEGVSMLLQLVQDMQNLDYFIEHDTLIGALSRTLAEERKKSTELATMILEIFFCFSSFSQLQPILLRNKIGKVTMDIVDLELKRYDIKLKQMRDRRSFVRFVAKQEKLLYVCFYILLNLAEDPKIEVKMVGRDLNKCLVAMLARKPQNDSMVSPTSSPSPSGGAFIDELHLLIVTFLKKLSIYTENKQQMAQYDVVKQLVPITTRKDPDLRVAVLKLLYNLSLDENLRASMVKEGMVPFFAECIRDPTSYATAVRLLYVISTDKCYETEFVEAVEPTLPLLADRIVSCRSKIVDAEIMALAINLSTQPLLCGAMCQNDTLHKLVKRAHQTFDPLLMRLIRNISSHTPDSGWSALDVLPRYLHELVGMIMNAYGGAQAGSPATQHFLVEALGTLSNIVTPDALYSELIVRHGLLDMLTKQLVPGFADDDLVLEAVKVLGVLAIDPEAAPLLGNARLVHLLFALLREKQEDEEMVLQIVYTLFRLLLHPESREAITAHEDLPEALLEQVVDPNVEIRRFAHHCLDLIIEYDEEWRERLMEKRFQASNRDWLRVMEGGGVDDHDGHDGQHSEFPHDDESEPHLYDADAQYMEWDEPRFIDELEEESEEEDAQ